MSNELLDHWKFIDPDSCIDPLDLDEDFATLWLQLLYTARCLFSTHTEFPIKGRLAPLLDRETVFTQESPHDRRDTDDIPRSSNCSEDLDLGRITSISQLSSLLPREFVLYCDDLFYKKLLNRELLRREFREPETLSVSEFVSGRDQKLNRRQKVYILFDNSSSMNGERFNKLFAAKSICIEYLRRVQQEGPQIYFRAFNQEIGDLKRIDTAGGVKGLIRSIVELNTYECFETRIAEAVMKAVQDIKGDPAFRQAEILMITDGLGDVPEDIKERLGRIKFHIILISGLDIDHYLKLFPDRESLEKGNLMHLSKDLSTGFDAYVNIKKVLHQVYRLREVADIFIRIPSLLGERFRFSNESELALIRDVRQDLEKRLRQNPSARVKYEIFQKVRYITKYLQIMLASAASRKIKMQVMEELDRFHALEERLMEDDWFACELENRRISAEREKKKLKGMPAVMRKADRSWMALMWDGLKRIVLVPWHLAGGLHAIVRGMIGIISRIQRRYKIQRRLRHINKRFMKILR